MNGIVQIDSDGIGILFVWLDDDYLMCRLTSRSRADYARPGLAPSACCRTGPCPLHHSLLSPVTAQSIVPHFYIIRVGALRSLFSAPSVHTFFFERRVLENITIYWGFKRNEILFDTYTAKSAPAV